MGRPGAKRKSNSEMDDAICYGWEQGWSSVRIFKYLTEKRFFGREQISERTVRNRMAECRNRDLTPWSPFDINETDNTPDDVRRIQPVQEWLSGESWGQLRLSRAAAWWVSRLRAIADLPPEWAWVLAMAYHRAKERGDKDMRCLDLALEFAVWDMTGVTGSRDLTDLDENLRAMDHNALRRRNLEVACQYASPDTWKVQWDDLLGFYDAAEALRGSYPPWADEEEPPPEEPAQE